MPIQASQPKTKANPFLHALDKPAVRPVTPLQAPRRSTGQVNVRPTPSVAPPRHRRSGFPILLGWALVGLLLAIPILLPVKPVEKAQVPALMPPLPVEYDYISSEFGPRWGRMHQGIDFAAQTGSPVYAASAGTVVISGWESGYGKSVVLEHGNNRQTRYAHCSRLLVKVGQQVAKGDLIAKVGSTGHSTGPHLHFEVILNGERKNPAWYYPFQAGQRLAASASSDVE